MNARYNGGRFEAALLPLRPSGRDDGLVEIPVVLSWLKGEPIGTAVLSVDETLRLGSELVAAARVANGFRR